MEANILTLQMRRARVKLLRLEQDLGRVTRNLDNATRNRIVGGVLLLAGSLALIGFLVGGNQLVAGMAAAGLLIGGLIFVRALARLGGARRSMHTVTDGVANARATLTELEAQSPIAE